jgi:hypothetical protein
MNGACKLLVTAASSQVPLAARVLIVLVMPVPIAIPIAFATCFQPLSSLYFAGSGCRGANVIWAEAQAAGIRAIAQEKPAQARHRGSRIGPMGRNYSGRYSCDRDRSGVCGLASKLMRRDQSQKCQRRRHVTGRDQERAVFEKRARAFSNLRSVSRNLIHL